MPTNEADLSQSSTPSLVYRKCAPRSLEPIVRGRPRVTVKSKYDKLAYTPIPSAMLHRYMPLRMASPAHILLPSGRQGRRGLNTRKGHAKMDATFGEPRSSKNPAIGKDNINIVVPSASDAATLRRRVIRPLTMRLSDAGARRETKLIYSLSSTPSLAQRRRDPRSLEPIVRGYSRPRQYLGRWRRCAIAMILSRSPSTR